MPAKLTIEDMCELAKARGGRCLSLEYIGSKTKLHWQCAKGHTWKATPSSIKTKTWCPDCAGNAPLTIHEMQIIANNRGGICLSQKYLGAHKKLEWLCSTGHRWWAKPNAIKTGSWCIICSGKAPLTIEEMRTVAQDRGGECLSPKIVNSRTNLQWKCAEGHVWEATPSEVRNGPTWCPYCSGKAPLTIEEMQNIAKGRGGRCLSPEIVNARLQLKWMCSEGHVWKSTPSSVKNSNSWCRTCAGKAPFSIEEMQSIAKERGGRCLSNKYSYKEKLQWECTERHTWPATAKSVRSGRWCRICQNKLGGEKQRLQSDEFLSRALAKHESRYEYDMKTYTGRLDPIDVICKEHGTFPQKAQDHLSGHGCPHCFAKGEAELKKIIEGLGFEVETQKKIKKRRYDFYLCDHNLLIERDGEQHYRKAWEGEDGFRKQIKIDAKKTMLALDHGYQIARIPYWVKNKDELLIELDNILAGNPTFPLIPDVEQSKLKPKPNGC